MNIGGAIKDLRLRRLLTQQQIAEKAMLTQGYYSSIENNNNKPTLEVINKIADALGVPIIIIHWLALEKSDIKKHRTSFYEKLQPVIDHLIQEIL